MPNTKRNFTNDGKIAMDLRAGKDRADTYYKRGRGLKKAAETLHKLTNAHVRVEILPTWPSGKAHKFESPGFPIKEAARQPTSTVSTADHAYVAPPIAPALPSPNKHMRIEVIDAPPTQQANRCGICGVEYGTPPDQLIDSLWAKCSKARCLFWSHMSCHGIFYATNAKSKKALDKWAKDHFFCPKHVPK